MRALLIVLYFYFCTTASAQNSPGPDSRPASQSDRITVGPIVLTQDVQGNAVDTSALMSFAVDTKADGLHLSLTIDASLVDLQHKFARIVDTIPLPRDNCKSFTLVNPVVSLGNRALMAEADNAVVVLSGDVDGWTCLENPVPDTYWDSTGCRGDLPFGGHYVFGCPKTRPGSPIKNKSFTQPFDATLPVKLQKTGDASLGLVLGQPNIKLGGQFVFIANGLLNIAGVNINDQAKKALERAIDPNKMTISVPKGYADLNPTIVDAAFRSDQGQLAIRIDMTALIPPARINEILGGLVKSLKKP
ncbi:hypothetical protein [Bradyrhizobium erythrophlei]|uniref:Uncharacterized protein n=1 Tax=Bradyrhizobium erythrophlei TaxID=1437360 RepID=A0A1M7UMR7_9BRAD|nr:hypothetical protein [Bradyrhizobium erythrophlei]SHN84240.1 hypothetical protein SAMN05444170_5827 [Bradyrhizobium erythrophlei]